MLFHLVPLLPVVTTEAAFFHVIFVSNSVIFLDPLTTYKGFGSNYWVSFLGP